MSSPPPVVKRAKATSAPKAMAAIPDPPIAAAAAANDLDELSMMTGNGYCIKCARIVKKKYVKVGKDANGELKKVHSIEDPDMNKSKCDGATELGVVFEQSDGKFGVYMRSFTIDRV